MISTRLEAAGEEELEIERVSGKFGVALMWQAGNIDPVMVASKGAVVIGERKAAVRRRYQAGLASRCAGER